MNYEINISADMSENKLNSIRYDIIYDKFWHDITLFISADSTNTFFCMNLKSGFIFFSPMK